jgi:hypothetical protein
MQLFRLAAACSTIFFVIAQAKVDNLVPMSDGHEAYNCELKTRPKGYSRCGPSLVSATIKLNNAMIDYLCFMARFLNLLKKIGDVAQIQIIQNFKCECYKILSSKV